MTEDNLEKQNDENQNNIHESQTEADNISVSQPAEQEQSMDREQVSFALEQIKSEQSLVLGITGGAIGAIAGAIAWAIVVAVTNYQLGLMAIAVGFMVGYAVRFFGKGIDKVYGVIGAAFSLFGCLAGNLLAVIYFISVSEKVPYWEMLARIDISVMISLMIETFQPMDLLFYGIAVYEGYQISFRPIDRKALRQYM